MFKRQNRFLFQDRLPKYSISSPFFVLRYEKNGDKDFQVAVVASKKIDKRAIKRNQAKRKVLHILHEQANLPHLKLVFYLKKSILSARVEDLKSEIERVFQEANSI